MSDNISSVDLSPAQFSERPGRTRRELTRRDLSPRIVARFASKFKTGDAESCWQWTGAHVPKGYGLFNIGRDNDGKQHTEYAHRVAYVIGHGDILAGRGSVMHSCDNPSCVNPAHLSFGTQSDNLRDAARKGRLVGRPRKAA